MLLFILAMIGVGYYFGAPLSTLLQIGASIQVAAVYVLVRNPRVLRLGALLILANLAYAALTHWPSPAGQHAQSIPPIMESAVTIFNTRALGTVSVFGYAGDLRAGAVSS